MQVFRLMAMPDKVIAFDELPERFLVGLEMAKAEGFPRHWKEFMGKRKKVMRIPPDRNPLTGETITYKPTEEEDYFFYLIDWNIRSQEDRWKEITEYVRENAPQDIRIPEKLEDMGKHLAKDKLEAVSLEPEDVPIIKLSKDVVIPPLPKETLEEVAAKEKEPKAAAQVVTLPCGEAGCNYKAHGSYAKNSLRFHKAKKHPKILEKV